MVGASGFEKVAKSFVTIIFFSSILLLSGWTVAESSTLKAAAQPANTGLPQGNIDNLSNNAQNTEKKLKDTKGVKIPNQYIVVLKSEDFLSSSRSSVVKAMSQGAEIKHIYQHALRGFAVKVPNDNVLDAIMKNPEVDYVQPDVKVQAFAQDLPTGINRVDGDLSSTRSGNGGGTVSVDIAIMDTGIQLSHPDLNVYRQVTFVSGTSSGNDDNGHGTSVAGIAAAKDDSSGVVGIAPGARLWAIKVLDNNGVGSNSDIIEGIDYVREHASEIDVVNLSFGAQGSNDALRTAIINSVAAGVAFVAAAGNGATDASSFFPASFPEVIAVSAIVDTDGKCGGVSSITTSAGRDDTFASFSNYGSVVDMAAPGVQIKTTTRGSSYSVLSGTSASAPHVTGATALYEFEHPGSSPSAIKNALRSLGSLPAVICDGNGHGYFTGDRDSIAEPLLYLGSGSPLSTQNCVTNLPITGIAASASESTNPPSNAIDNNFGTRWANPALGSWIRADLGSTQKICSVDIAWYRGNERHYHFVIATSTDRITFRNVFSGDSSGTTQNSEKYTFPATDARYVRITVNGNTQNIAASIYELDLFGFSSANFPPVASNQAVAVNKNTAKSITLTATDPNNDPLAYFIVTPPQHGTITHVGTSRSLIYSPDTGYLGPDTFTFRANDGIINSNIATVTISVQNTASCTTNLRITGIAASASESTNPPSYAIDNNFGTRWATPIFGSWIRADLGSTQKICSVDIAWYRGNERHYHFVIATSTDRITFRNLFSGDSSGTTLNSEKYTFPTTDARYVRVTVNGNTQNNWATLYELDVFGSTSLSTTYYFSPGLSLSGPK